MIVVHGTKKFLDRLAKAPRAGDNAASSTALGDWYATVLWWTPRVALFVNEQTLLPVLVPLAPSRTVIDRFAGAFAQTLGRHGVDQTFINDELARMAPYQLAKTSNRSTVGIMNEFSLLAGLEFDFDSGDRDLIELSVRLAATPCGPLYGRHVSPDRELLATVAELSDTAQPERCERQGMGSRH